MENILVTECEQKYVVPNYKDYKVEIFNQIEEVGNVIFIEHREYTHTYYDNDIFTLAKNGALFRIKEKQKQKYSLHFKYPGIVIGNVLVRSEVKSRFELSAHESPLETDCFAVDNVKNFILRQGDEGYTSLRPILRIRLNREIYYILRKQDKKWIRGNAIGCLSFDHVSCCLVGDESRRVETFNEIEYEYNYSCKLDEKTSLQNMIYTKFNNVNIIPSYETKYLQAIKALGVNIRN